MSYPESLKADDYTKGKYLEVIKHIPPNIFKQYLVKLSKVAKTTNHNDRVRELEKRAMDWEMGERLDMNMLNVGEYIIAETPHAGISHISWMFLIPIERDDNKRVARLRGGAVRYIQLGWNINKEIIIQDDGIREHGIVDNGWSGSRNLYFYKGTTGFDFINWNTNPFNSIK